MFSIIFITAIFYTPLLEMVLFGLCIMFKVFDGPIYAIIGVIFFTDSFDIFVPPCLSILCASFIFSYYLFFMSIFIYSILLFISAEDVGIISGIGSYFIYEIFLIEFVYIWVAPIGIGVIGVIGLEIIVEAGTAKPVVGGIIFCILFY
jgi:hypothetical protein